MTQDVLKKLAEQPEPNFKYELVDPKIHPSQWRWDFTFGSGSVVTTIPMPPDSHIKSRCEGRYFEKVDYRW
jgi:hypothetical protein